MKPFCAKEEINGLKLYFEIMGEGHPLILLHGLTLDARMWDDQFEVFSGKYKVIRYDLCGFGRSDIPETPHSHIEDLLALLNVLGIDKTHLVGLSRGGRVAVDFTLEHPERVNGLVLASSALSGFVWSNNIGQRLSEIRTLAKESIAKATELWLNEPMFTPSRKNLSTWLRLGKIVSEYSGIHWLKLGMESWSMNPPAIQRLSEIEVPTLIIGGGLDMSDFHAVAEILTKNIKNAKRILIPEAGHMVNMEKSQEFNHVVLDFLDEFN